MLGKIIITLLVIVAAIVVIKQRPKDPATAGKGARKGAGKTTGKKPTAGTGATGKSAASTADQQDATAASSMSEFRLAAYLFLILMFGAAAILYYQRWQDDHTVLTISLFRDGLSAPVTFQVYKYQLDSRSFTTLDGILITVADSERMEVQGLE